ncbi:hypothetical protein [Comamonas odontotermitis]|uniref:hypothetical protein n=1 Tax=Comamonas odontotermitis TaxID=379895 RepID=UPI001CC6C538|nr:hypothetical protein [Comamonas odontotermitis]UBB18555.1 hypothetical protein LAD35_07940 [Comamonas odontotermitis]
MTFKGVFIDDTVEAAQYAELLSTPGKNGISIEYKQVTRATELVDWIFGNKIDLVLLDFRLDENPDALDPQHSYLGSGLAQLLRDKAINQPNLDFPIVLVSAENKFEKYYYPDSTAHDLFDRTYGKEFAIENTQAISNQLLDICIGYKLIKTNWNIDSSRFSLFSLENNEREIIENQEIRLGLSNAGAPHLVASFIFRNLIDRPGILFSDEDIAARLGVKDIEPVVSFLKKKGVLYNGVFSAGWRRWWAHRFNLMAEEVFGRRPTTMSGEERANIINDKMGALVKPAESRWNKSSREKFAFACACCSFPTEIRHSVSAFDPNTPRFAQRKRICWDCVQTDKNLLKKLEVDDIDKIIASQVKHKNRDEKEPE